MLMIKKSNEVVVQTSVPSNAPVENNELEQINSKIENLNNKLNNQQTLLNKLQQTVDDISNFLKGIFNSIFAN
jgi:septal ring factor EnvC (AmiA/AmiB activator)